MHYCGLLQGQVGRIGAETFGPAANGRADTPTSKWAVDDGGDVGVNGPVQEGNIISGVGR